MASAKSAPTRTVATLADATAKTRSLIEDLQARLASPEKAVEAGEQEETEEELERQLKAYFERALTAPNRAVPAILEEMRQRVIDGVVDKIIAEWSEPQQNAVRGGALQREVIERLIDRVVEQLQKAARPSTVPA
jgi:hypothetical protein